MDQKTLEKKLFSSVQKPKTAKQLKIELDIIEILLEKNILVELPKIKPTHKPKFKLTEHGEKTIKENKEFLRNILNKIKVKTESVSKERSSAEISKVRGQESAFSSKDTVKTYNNAVNYLKPYVGNIEKRLTDIEEIIGPIKIIIDQMNIIKIIDSLIITEIELLHKNNPRDAIFPISKIMINLEAKGASKSLLDQRFLELEKRRLITLQAANDPRRIENKRYGIYIPHRGLLYYCSMN